ncbi:MAG: NADH:flavin oxidoreductase/NADH oxidase family protein [Deltaproteobacteria bacterium]|nr:NADH:flavin oxidoreductase/NADH oxidase family protein [Deltaproteobacteria bacterium]
MTSPASILARPLTLPCGAQLRNRLAKAAMSEAIADADGGPSERLVRLYERWGRGGAGMLLTGNVIVDRGGRTEPANVVVHDDRHLAGLRRWADAAQAHGAALWMQISHAGRQSSRGVTREPVAPSAVKLRGMPGMFAPPRALAADEIETLVERFAIVAEMAQRAGFGGVQIHAAHGYLVSQFLSPLVNRRDDAWGGDATRRMAFLLAIVGRMRARVGAGFPIAVKLNSADFQRGGFTTDDAIEVVRALDAAGIDLLEVSGGNYESPAMAGRGELPVPTRESTVAREAYFLEYARMLRAHTRAPIMLTGGLRSAAAMAAAITDGDADVIGLGRPLTIERERAARLLDCSVEVARGVRLHTGVRMIDDALQVMWFQQQMQRMADGHEPDPSLGRVRALVQGMRDNLRSRALPPAPALTSA